MISVEKATEIVLAHSVDWGTEEISLDHGINRVLSEDLHTDRDMPPFDRVTMDGIAIKYHDYKVGERQYQITGMAAAGSPLQGWTGSGTCLEVMTGAILPTGTDTVIRYEDLSVAEGQATILIDSIKGGQNIHQRGSDREEGSLIVRRGTILSPAEINIAATLGKSRLNAQRLPKTVVFSTGDELVPIDSIPAPHQIRRSNSHMVRASLTSFGIQAEVLHIKDDQEQLTKELSHILDQYDLVILSGGVSAGKYDLIPDTLKSLGVQQHFHKVRQRPGKPIFFGSKSDGTTVFGLPGNPASTFLCTNKYILPWLNNSLGLSIKNISAIMAEDITFSKDLTYFAQVKLEILEGRLLAYPVLGKGSGDLANLADADGFVEISAALPGLTKGDIAPVYVYRTLA